MLFNVTEKVLCFHVGLLYEAKVLKAEKWTGEENVHKHTGPHYFVHYMGWRARWDEWVPESRMLKLNDDNLAKQKALVESVKAAQEAKHKENSASSSGGRKSGGGAGGAGAAGSGGTRDTTDAHEGGDRRKQKESRGTKRGRETVEQEEEYVKRPEIKLNVPDVLKVRLVDDWEYVTKRNQLVPLPRSPNVDDIIAAYRTHYLSVKKEAAAKGARPPAILNEVLGGLRTYFNKALGSNLLYRFERTQYVHANRDHQDSDGEPLEPSKIYGAEHLLRLFVNLPSMIAHTTMDSESIALLKEHLAEFLAFLVREQKRFFVSEYETPSTSYNRFAAT